MEKVKSTSKSKAEKTPKTNSKGARTSAAVKTTSTRKSVKSLPGEDEIRLKAQEIYDERISRGFVGTAESDWLKAEKLLRD